MVDPEEKETADAYITRVRATYAGQKRPAHYGAHVVPETGERFDAYARPAPERKGPNPKARARAKAARQARKKNR